MSVEQYWAAFCEKIGKKITYYDAFQFGQLADELANLVLAGKKTATCSSYPLYVLEKQPLPKVGDYSIVLNSADEPVAVIETVNVQVVPFNDVTEAFALQEGLASYEQWRIEHIRFFSELLPHYKLQFQPNMLTVCEQFRVVATAM